MSAEVDVILDVLRCEFAANADPERAASMATYMRDQFPYFGLPAPASASLAAPCAPYWPIQRKRN